MYYSVDDLHKKVFIIAGEASGDLHGKNLVRALIKQDPELEILAYGGPKMEKAGAKILRDYKSYAFMGFYEVAKNLRIVLKNIKETEKIILQAQPNVIVFIDFPGFNLRIAKRLRAQLPKTHFIYYIAPQVWAWKKNRVHDLNKLMDKIYVILPFEKDFFDNYGYDVTYAGHPLLDEIMPGPVSEKDENLIAVLPGSRIQEIQKTLPIFIQTAEKLPEFNFSISTMSHVPFEVYENILKKGPSLNNISLYKGETYQLLIKASLGLITSGTATLETALLGTPQIVTYKTSGISYFIGKQIVDIKYISLVNLIMNRAVVPELLQDNFNAQNILREINRLNDKDIRSKMLADYQELLEKLGAKGPSTDIATYILNILEE